MHPFDIVIVTPALAVANNGNWQTAHRWERMLSPAYRVRLAGAWDGGDEHLMIALHARRSAGSVANWHKLRPRAPLILVLTGTDLYRDIADSAVACTSVESANRLVVLNELGARSLPPAQQWKARVVLQSCAARQPLDKARAHMRALMVGHLRDEKSPRTYFEAARLLGHRADIKFDLVGAALDAVLGDQAAALMATCPRFRWLGAQPHNVTRKRIQSAHVLVHPSRMEGGANVVIEAIRSGTPVLASRIDGNLGLLGDRYEGYFPVGDAAALATLLGRLREEPGLHARLQAQCADRSPLFEPALESAAVLALAAEWLVSDRGTPAWRREAGAPAAPVNCD